MSVFMCVCVCPSIPPPEPQTACSAVMDIWLPLTLMVALMFNTAWETSDFVYIGGWAGRRHLFLCVCSPGVWCYSAYACKFLLCVCVRQNTDILILTSFSSWALTSVFFYCLLNYRDQGGEARWVTCEEEIRMACIIRAYGMGREGEGRKGRDLKLRRWQVKK